MKGEHVERKKEVGQKEAGKKRYGTALSNTKLAGEMQGSGLGWRLAHLAAKGPWMSPRPGEDEAS